MNHSTYFQLNDVTEGKPVFFLPPGDGFWFQSLPLARNMSIPAYGLNLNIWVVNIKTDPELHGHFIDMIRSLDTEYPGDHQLIGISLGASLAFEIAVKMQQKYDENSKLILLDGSPYHSQVNYYYLKNHLLGDHTMDQYSQGLLVYLSFLATFNAPKLKEVITACDKKSGKLEKFTEIVKKGGGLNEKHANVVAEFGDIFYQRATILGEKPFAGNVYYGDCLLIRASEKIFSGCRDNIPADYGLSQVCENHKFA